MYLRLWWKDARQFWPIWAFLMLAAGVTQALFHHYADVGVRESFLVSLAMGWAFLYAFAVGAAAFAGERETGTLRLLDVLPASRGTVWAGKVSFAIASTAALALVLLAMALLDVPAGSSRWSARGNDSPAHFGVVMFQGLAWGLLLSSMLNSALVAAVAAIVITAISVLLMADRVHDLQGLMTGELAVALAALAGSLVVFAWGRRIRLVVFATLSAVMAVIGLMAIGRYFMADYIRDVYSLRDWGIAAALAVLAGSVLALAWSWRGRFVPLDLRLRSPFEVTWTASPREGSERPRPSITSPTVAAVSGMTTIAAAIAAPAPGRIIGSAIWSADQPRPRSWLAELRFLIRQTMREGRTTWLLILAIGLICPAGLLLDPNPPLSDGSPIPFVCNGIIALLAGVSVFGLENRRRTYRFLVHHGARPGVVWLAKLVAWGFGLALIWGPLAYLVVQAPKSPAAAEQWMLLALSLPLGLAVALLCGMAIPRGITAGVVALVTTLFIAFGEIGLVQVGMLPAWGMLVLPAALLAVTWIWSGDWLLDRPAPGRWVRLGLLLSGALATAFAGHAGWRAWSIPDVGPIPPPSAWAAATVPLPPDRNAADVYREAGRLMERVVPRKAPTAGASRVPFGLDEHPGLSTLIRRAAARPECRFFDPDRIDLRNMGDLPPMRELAHAVVTHARGRLKRGDLGAAWDDVVLLFRMARHLGQGSVMNLALHALFIEDQALALAMEWANAPGQTPDRLRAAIVAHLALPAMTPAAEVVRGEGLLVERTIRLPADDLKDVLLEASGWTARYGTFWPMLWLDMITTPWERARRAAHSPSHLPGSAIRVAGALAAADESVLVPGGRVGSPWGTSLAGGAAHSQHRGGLDCQRPQRGRPPGTGPGHGRPRVAAPPRRAIPR